jgi:ABC-type nitrate/sulfonate/bicarbonate transport system substrate-binding protein
VLPAVTRSARPLVTRRRRTTVRRIVAGAAALALALAPAGCGGEDKEKLAPGSTLRVGYSQIPDGADLAGRMAVERYGRAHDVKVKFQRIQGGPSSMAALRRGDVDILSLNQPDVVKAAGEGLGIKAILGSKMFPEYVFVASPPISRPAQLRGKRIAVQGHGSDTLAFAQLVLREAGLTANDARLLTIPSSSARVAAMVANRADATGVRYHEYLRLLDDRPRTRTLAEMRTYAPGRMTQVWLVTEKFARENAARLRGLVREMLGTYDSMYTPEGRRAWLAAAAETFRGEPASTPPRLYEYYRRHGLWPRADRPITAEEHRRQVNQMVRDGEIPKFVAFETVWEPSFWQSAAGGRS